MLPFFRILRLAEHPPWRVARGALLKALDAALSCAPFFALYYGLRAALGGEQSQTFAIQAGLWLGFALVCQFLLSWQAMRDTMIEGYRITAQLRLQLGERLRGIGLGFFTRRALGDVLSVATNDVDRAESIFTHKLANLIYLLAAPLTVLAFLTPIDPALAAAMALAAPAAVIGVMWSHRHLTRLGARMRAATAAAMSRLVEYCAGIKVIRGFGLTGARFGALDAALREQRDIGIKLEAIGGTAITAYQLILEFAFLTLIVFGVWRVANGATDAATLILFLAVSHKFYGPLKDVSIELAEIRAFSGSVERIEELHREPVQTGGPFKPTRFDVSFDRVSFRYDETEPEVLHEVSFTASQGTLTALVGPSGSGKSTILQLAARFFDPTSGTVKIGGVDLRGANGDEVLRHISIVFQDVYLFNETILENVRIGRPSASDGEVEAACKAAYAHDFVRALPQGYHTLTGEGGANLSGGQRQRISIARAFLKNAPILLLDEATSAIDATSEREVQAALRGLRAGRTAISIAHNLNAVADADQIIVLQRGAIAETGRHAQLLAASGLYAALFADLHAEETA